MIARRFAGARSIQQKVFGVIVALTLAIVAFLVVYFPTRHIQSLRSGMEKKATTYGNLMSRQVESAIAFNDRATAREVFEAAAVDTDVRGIALYNDRGVALYVHGDLTSATAPAMAATAQVEVGDLSVRSTTPVVSKEGPRGLLVVELSNAGIAVERAEIRRTSLLVGFGALAAGFLAAWLIGRSLAKRLRAIAEATHAVAEGDLSQRPLVDDSADEVGQLARSFNEMQSNIVGLVAQISATAAEEKTRLDDLVAKRTSELDVRNQDMRLVLNHVGEGFLTLDRQGVVSVERSAVVDRWLGKAEDGCTFWSHIAPLDEAVSAWFKVSWAAIFDDVLPLELALEQMPKALRVGATFLSFEYTPITVDGALAKVLLIISDVTAQKARERAEASQRELLGILDRATRDKAGVLEFFVEVEQLLRVITGDVHASRADLMRAIHTLKGNCGIFALQSIVELCHSIEEGMATDDACPTLVTRTELAARWSLVSSSVRALLGEGNVRRIEIAQMEHEMILDAIRTGVSRSELAHIVTLWKLETTEERLARIAEQTRAVAARLDKPNIEVRIEHNGLRLDPERWSPFWAAFTHAVRNAVDHGLETEDERFSAGKAGAGTIKLRTYLAGSQLVIEIADDGRGIDWEKLRGRASLLGLATQSRADLEELLFRDGVSTKALATEYSGRGVGLGAVRAACIALGGKVHVSSTQGKGTSFQFWMPAAGPALVRAARSVSVLPAAMV